MAGAFSASGQLSAGGGQGFLCGARRGRQRFRRSYTCRKGYPVVMKNSKVSKADEINGRDSQTAVGRPDGINGRDRCGRCSAGVKRSELKHWPPHNEARNKLYCEGDDDLMANRDRPNPRCCQSFKLVSLTGRRSTDSIRARGNNNAASRGRIDDCKPNPPLSIKNTCNQGGVHR